VLETELPSRNREPAFVAKKAIRVQRLPWFYWQDEQVDEQVDGATSVMHFQMTKRAYEQILALAAGSKLRIRPSETGSQTR